MGGRGEGGGKGYSVCTLWQRLLSNGKINTTLIGGRERTVELLYLSNEELSVSLAFSLVVIYYLLLC
jgi:hypothetical protein